MKIFSAPETVVLWTQVILDKEISAETADYFECCYSMMDHILEFCLFTIHTIKPLSSIL